MAQFDNEAASGSAGASLSYSEEAAWQEFRERPDTFFWRGLMLSVDLPPGAGSSYARRVVDHVVAKHEVFRTSYEGANGHVDRTILPAYQHELIESEGPIEVIVGKPGTRLSPADLFHPWLTPGPDGRRRLSLDINEMITDNWSAARLRDELAALVEAMPPDSDPVNPVTTTGYSEFALEQRGRRVPEETTSYWRQQLAGLTEADYLPADGPDPSGEGAGERVVVFADDLTAAMRELCRQFRLTPFMAAVALVTAVMATNGETRDVTLATVISSRSARWADVQGNFGTSLLLRTALPPEPSFADIVQNCRRAVMGALTHQVHVRQLQEVLQRELPQPPVRVSYLPRGSHHYSQLDSKQSGEGWREQALFPTWPVEVGFAEDQQRRVAIWLNYDATRFSHAAMERFLDRCARLLRLVAADQALTTSELARRLTAAG
jgi:hypothetical protein